MLYRQRILNARRKKNDYRREVKRDEQGYWTHPALIRSGCQTTPQLMWWLRVQKLECFVMTMRDEATEAFCAGWDDGPDASAWELVPPPGWAGFSVLYIHGTDPSATGSVIPQKPDASAGRRCPTPEAGKTSFPTPGVSQKQ
jgi:hypothetical protein